MEKFYRYILSVDDGHAPCSDNGLLTLGTCKPTIRRCACVGDYVAGYMPSRLGEGSLVWFGKIERLISHRDYQREFQDRQDANYRYNVGAEKPTRVDPNYHSDDPQLEQDIRYPVLIFDMKNSWYFGSEPKQPPEWLDQLKAAGQGHRVNFRVDRDIEQMVQWLCTVGLPGIHGNPRDEYNDNCKSNCIRIDAKQGC